MLLFFKKCHKYKKCNKNAKAKTQWIDLFKLSNNKYVLAKTGHSIAFISNDALGK